MFIPVFSYAQSIECVDCRKITGMCETCTGKNDSEYFTGVLLKNASGVTVNKIAKPFKSIVTKGSRVTVKGFDDKVVELVLPCYGYSSATSLVAKLCECQAPPIGGSGTFNALTGDVTSTATGGATTINSGVVTNAKLATMPTLTILGNSTGATAAPQYLSPSVAKSLLAITDGDVKTLASNTINGTVYAANSSLQLINTAMVSQIGSNQTNVQNAYAAMGLTLGATNLGTFTGGIIPANFFVKSALQALSDDNLTRQKSIMLRQSGTNVGTLGGFTKYNFIGATVVANGGDATQADITIAGGGAVYPSRVQSNGADIKYWVVSGTPTVTFSKASGIGTITVSGGAIELNRVQLNLSNTDLDGSNLFTCTFPTTQSATFLQYPTVSQINTQNAAPPSSVPHTVRNSGSAPVVTFTGGTAGTNITIKTGDLTIMGNPGTYTLVLNF